jgi:hypothetical protein
MDFKNQGGIQGQSWGQLIEKSVLENVRYPQGCIYEDTLTEYKVIESAGKMVVLHEAKYYYVQRSGSITHGDVERVNLGICYANEARYIDLVSRRPELKDNVLHRYLYNFTKLARDGVSEKNMKEFLERREFFRSVYDDLRANPYMKWMEKLELPLLYKSDGKKSVCLWILEMFRMTARIPWMLREQRSRRGSAL